MTDSKKTGRFASVILAALFLSIILPGCSGPSRNTAEQNDGTQPDTIINQDAMNRTAGPEDMAEVREITQAGLAPVSADSLREGVWPVDMESSSSMFRAEHCDLMVADGKLTVILHMASDSYSWMFAGTAAEAAVSDTEAYISLTADGETRLFTLPLNALDEPEPFAAYSRRKKLWYDRTLLFRSDSLPAEAFADGYFTTPESLELTDGSYTIEVSLSGGSGKAYVESPAPFTVENGVCTAVIHWSSPHYDYMKINSEQYFPVNTEGNSAFEIPVTIFDRPVSILADTIAMSTPYEIAYSLTFFSGTIKAAPDSENSENSGTASENAGMIREELLYAHEFAIDRFPDGNALISIGNDRLLILAEGADMPENPGENVVILRQPVRNVYLAASSAMDFFRRLDALSAVRLTSTSGNNWSFPDVREALENKTMLYTGKYSAPDFETLVTEKCTLAVESTMIYHSPEIREQIERLGIPVIVERSSYETHPLGRMEWIKLYGLLSGKETEAAAFFNTQTAALADVLSEENPDQTGKTAAFFSLSANGYAVVRKPGDYVVKMIEMAGGQYAFSNLIPEEENALSTMNLQMELFYAGAKDADILIYNGTIDGGMETLSQLLGKNALLNACRAVKNGDVWCTERNLFQETTAAANIITELHAVLSGNASDTLTYFHKLR